MPRQVPDNSPIGQHTGLLREAAMPWTSEPIALHDGLVIQVRATAEGVVVGKQVDGVFASDTLYIPEQAEQLAAALTEGAARSRAMR